MEQSSTPGGTSGGSLHHGEGGGSSCMSGGGGQQQNSNTVDHVFLSWRSLHQPAFRREVLKALRLPNPPILRAQTIAEILRLHFQDVCEVCFFMVKPSDPKVDEATKNFDIGTTPGKNIQQEAGAEDADQFEKVIEQWPLPLPWTRSPHGAHRFGKLDVSLTRTKNSCLRVCFVDNNNFMEASPAEFLRRIVSPTSAALREILTPNDFSNYLQGLLLPYLNYHDEVVRRQEEKERMRVAEELQKVTQAATAALVVPPPAGVVCSTIPANCSATIVPPNNQDNFSLQNKPEASTITKPAQHQTSSGGSMANASASDVDTILQLAGLTVTRNESSKPPSPAKAERESRVAPQTMNALQLLGEAGGGTGSNSSSASGGMAINNNYHLANSSGGSFDHANNNYAGSGSPESNDDSGNNGRSRKWAPKPAKKADDGDFFKTIDLMLTNGGGTNAGAPPAADPAVVNQALAHLFGGGGGTTTSSSGGGNVGNINPKSNSGVRLSGPGAQSSPGAPHAIRQPPVGISYHELLYGPTPTTGRSVGPPSGSATNRSEDRGTMMNNSSHLRSGSRSGRHDLSRGNNANGLNDDSYNYSDHGGLARGAGQGGTSTGGQHGQLHSAHNDHSGRGRHHDSSRGGRNYSNQDDNYGHDRDRGGAGPHGANNRDREHRDRENHNHHRGDHRGGRGGHHQNDDHSGRHAGVNNNTHRSTTGAQNRHRSGGTNYTPKAGGGGYKRPHQNEPVGFDQLEGKAARDCSIATPRNYDINYGSHRNNYNMQDRGDNYHRGRNHERDHLRGGGGGRGNGGNSNMHSNRGGSNYNDNHQRRSRDRNMRGSSYNDDRSPGVPFGNIMGARGGGSHHNSFGDPLKGGMYSDNWMNPHNGGKDRPLTGPDRPAWGKMDGGGSGKSSWIAGGGPYGGGEQRGVGPFVPPDMMAAKGSWSEHHMMSKGGDHMMKGGPPGGGPSSWGPPGSWGGPMGKAEWEHMMMVKGKMGAGGGYGGKYHDMMELHSMKGGGGSRNSSKENNYGNNSHHSSSGNNKEGNNPQSQSRGGGGTSSRGNKKDDHYDNPNLCPLGGGKGGGEWWMNNNASKSNDNDSVLGNNKNRNQDENSSTQQESYSQQNNYRKSSKEVDNTKEKSEQESCNSSTSHNNNNYRSKSGQNHQSQNRQERKGSQVLPPPERKLSKEVDRNKAATNNSGAGVVPERKVSGDRSSHFAGGCSGGNYRSNYGSGTSYHGQNGPPPRGGPGCSSAARDHFDHRGPQRYNQEGGGGGPYGGGYSGASDQHGPPLHDRNHRGGGPAFVPETNASMGATGGAYGQGGRGGYDQPQALEAPNEDPLKHMFEMNNPSAYGTSSSHSGGPPPPLQDHSSTSEQREIENALLGEDHGTTSSPNRGGISSGAQNKSKNSSNYNPMQNKINTDILHQRGGITSFENAMSMKKNTPSPNKPAQHDFQHVGTTTTSSAHYGTGYGSSCGTAEAGLGGQLQQGPPNGAAAPEDTVSSLSNYNSNAPYGQQHAGGPRGSKAAPNEMSTFPTSSTTASSPSLPEDSGHGHHNNSEPAGCSAAADMAALLMGAAAENDDLEDFPAAPGAFDVGALHEDSGRTTANAGSARTAGCAATIGDQLRQQEAAHGGGRGGQDVDLQPSSTTNSTSTTPNVMPDPYKRGPDQEQNPAHYNSSSSMTSSEGQMLSAFDDPQTTSDHWHSNAAAAHHGAYPGAGAHDQSHWYNSSTGAAHGGGGSGISPTSNLNSCIYGSNIQGPPGQGRPKFHPPPGQGGGGTRGERSRSGMKGGRGDATNTSRGGCDRTYSGDQAAQFWGTSSGTSGVDAAASAAYAEQLYNSYNYGTAAGGAYNNPYEQTSCNANKTAATATDGDTDKHAAAAETDEHVSTSTFPDSTKISAAGDPACWTSKKTSAGFFAGQDQSNTDQATELQNSMMGAGGSSSFGLQQPTSGTTASQHQPRAESKDNRRGRNKSTSRRRSRGGTHHSNRRGSADDVGGGRGRGGDHQAGRKRSHHRERRDRSRSRGRGGGGRRGCSRRGRRGSKF
ncbi:unnamed protein product [Amoebophrya sp. A120]|nr:unnamed protein product [Amoebophrya sp. A120]|eukprot:GSA120T00018751001.1